MAEIVPIILSVACPYTSCGAKVGEVCANARNGKPMPGGHKDRKQALAESRRPKGHRVEMSYNCWQIVRLVATSMFYDLDRAVEDEIEADDGGTFFDPSEMNKLRRLLDELPPRDWGNVITLRRGRTRTVRPKTHRQRFSGSVLITLKAVMKEAKELKGGSFQNPICQIHREWMKIEVSPIDLLASLA